MSVEKTKKIKIERRTQSGMSYYVDANGILKGEWGGFEKTDRKGSKNEIIFVIYYTRYHKYIPIDEYGYFYNFFSCEKYDGVSRIDTDCYGSNYHGPTTIIDLCFPPHEGIFYLCEKNNRFGIIDSKGEEILHTCYNNISQISNSLTFIVRCETGSFIYNLKHKTQSKVFEEISVSKHNYLTFGVNGRYGLLDYTGRVILEPIYEKRKIIGSDEFPLQIDFNGNKYGVYVFNDMFYGKIPLNVYDICFNVKANSVSSSHSIFITRKNGKYGILSWNTTVIVKPELDDIVLFDGGICCTCYSTKEGKSINIVFVIGKKEGKYLLYNAINGNCIINNCDELKYMTRGHRGHDCFAVFKKGNEFGYVTAEEIIISSINYDTIDFLFYDIMVMKDGKKGILNYRGQVEIPCQYDEIEVLDIRKYKINKDGITEIVDLCPRRGEWETTQSYNNYLERRHYSKYRGTSAQDEMGYSDDDIDTIFDGDPSAYWNID